ncbi:hypothetical protein M422DRAFT_29539 [Sphaerobolus stellatus SS14]|uniref:Uncharacterized protein n=1 Tax=Sphaerobolus stellatus (strain SS14) TaxID=990650 RepID=A0A0C9VFX6_SPHS4|nr:hypothetical protein M422DRAFT_29539 [Sphaerobolus stellatus SS14]
MDTGNQDQDNAAPVHANSNESRKSLTHGISLFGQLAPNAAAYASILAAPALGAAAIRYGWMRLIRTGSISILANTPPVVHTGISFLNKFITGNVNFLKAGLDPSIPPFLRGFLSSFLTCAYIPFIEASRTEPRVSYPWLVGTMGQLLGRGIAYPIWWSVFAASGAARPTPVESAGSAIRDHYTAEGNLLAVVLGFLIPNLAFVKTQEDSWTLTWFLHPLSMALIQKLYVVLRTRLSGPPHDTQDIRDGTHLLTLATCAVGFCYASIIHFRVMFPRIFNGQWKNLLGLDFSIPAEGTVSLAENVFHTLQWDAVSVFVSSLVAVLAFARNKSQAWKIAVWDLVGTLLFGTGGTLNVLWIWREVNLKRDREALARQS